MVVTERDRQVLRFLAKWRFGTIKQLRRSGIFTTTQKRCYNRLLELCNAKLIKSGRLANGLTYYHLLPKGGEVIGLDYPWYSRVYKGASDSTVAQYLVYVDVAQILGIEYIALQEVLPRFSTASYDVFKKVVKLHERFFEQDGRLHALVVDFGLSPKYLAERASAYARLPLTVKNNLIVAFLIFNQVKKKAVVGAISNHRLNYKIIKSKWIY